MGLSISSTEGNLKSRSSVSNQIQFRKRKIKAVPTGFSSITTRTLLILLASTKIVHGFQWMPLLSTRSSKHLQPMYIPLPTILGRRFSQPQNTVTEENNFLLLRASKLDSDETIIEYQSDDKYDRGEMHISAAVNEGDTVVYRTGSWYVDGVLVGDEDATPAYEYCRVESIQLVWTHNCEHGVLRGLAVDLSEDDNSEQQGQHLSLRTPLDEVQFGPEQIIAWISNVVWEPNNEDETGEGEIGNCSVMLDSSMWRENDANAIYDDEW